MERDHPCPQAKSCTDLLGKRGKAHNQLAVVVDQHHEDGARRITVADVLANRKIKVTRQDIQPHMKPYRELQGNILNVVRYQKNVLAARHVHDQGRVAIRPEPLITLALRLGEERDCACRCRGRHAWHIAQAKSRHLLLPHCAPASLAELRRRCHCKLKAVWAEWPG